MRSSRTTDSSACSTLARGNAPPPGHTDLAAVITFTLKYQLRDGNDPVDDLVE